MEYTIYKLCSKNDKIKDCYVGSTKNLKMRIRKHKHCCNNTFSDMYNRKVYRFIRDNGGWDNWKFEELESGNCEDKLSKLKIERVWIEKLNATLNELIPSRTMKEYYEKNKDTIKEYQKEYYEKNKDKFKEYYKQKVPCPECKKLISRNNISAHKKRIH